MDEKIINSEISGEMRKAYLDYAMSVIVSRAIPAVEDGLKPVQRRILYSMFKMGLRPETQTKKSARIVGDVIGKYHPHGDVSIYEAMVRLTQDFSLRYPLVYGQGNFGSIDGDPPAAYRYTEAKLKKLSYELLEDLDKETVEFIPNFDNSLKEPVLLPGKVPNILLNGASGIAVGMATNLPPYNLSEVVDAIIAYIKNPEINVNELLKLIKGPDFPTGGLLFGDMKELFETGKGRLVMRGKIEEEADKDKNSLIITEIPYMLNKSTLIKQIAEVVQLRKLRDVTNLTDESSKGKIRIVLKLKKFTEPEFIKNFLFKYTRLQDTFHVNSLVLVKGKPKVLNLKGFLSCYVEYREKIIILRSNFELKKSKNRKEIVEGLLFALDKMNEIIKIIRERDNAEEELKNRFKFTINQVKAILEMKLRQLSKLEYGLLKKELGKLIEEMKRLEKILGNREEVLKIIIGDVEKLKENYGDPRKTRILKNFGELSEKDLIKEEEVIVTITEKGYCKRMSVGVYKEQKRGGRGVIGSGLTEGDFVKQLIQCSTHDYLLFFTTRGRVFWLKVYDLPSSEKYGKGRALINLLKLREENITKVISLNNFDDFLVMVTKKGIVKKIALSNFSKIRPSGTKAINLPEDNSDFLVGVELIKLSQGMLLATKKGKSIRFDSNSLRSMGRASYGVRGIRLGNSDEVVSLEVLDTEEILTITQKGYGKRTAVKDYRKTSRGGKGIINLKISEKTGEVVKTVSVNDEDSIIVTTAKGIVIRTSLKNIRVMGRSAQGVRIVRLQEGDHVSDLVKVEEEI